MRYAYRSAAAVADDREDGVVAAGAAGGRVDDDEDGLVLHEREGRGREQVGDVAFAEDLLERVEREASELGFDEVRAVLRAKKSKMHRCQYQDASGYDGSTRAAARE